MQKRCFFLLSFREFFKVGKSKMKMIKVMKTKAKDEIMV